MKLAEIIRTNNWLSVELTLLNLYPDQQENIEAYKEVYKKLVTSEIEESEIQIEIEKAYDEVTSEENIPHIYGTKSRKNENQITENLAIEFVPWKEWLGMNLSRKALADFNELEIISHCLYEMTFMGYIEDEIQGQLTDLEKTVNEYKNMSAEEKKNNTRSIDDLFMEIENE